MRRREQMRGREEKRRREQMRGRKQEKRAEERERRRWKDVNKYIYV